MCFNPFYDCVLPPTHIDRFLSNTDAVDTDDTDGCHTAYSVHHYRTEYCDHTGPSAVYDELWREGLCAMR